MLGGVARTLRVRRLRACLLGFMGWCVENKSTTTTYIPTYARSKAKTNTNTMSRQSMAPQRNLSLTEELEKLEQSITLTLQGKQAASCPAQRD